MAKFDGLISLWRNPPSCKYWTAANGRNRETFLHLLSAQLQEVWSQEGHGNIIDLVVFATAQELANVWGQLMELLEHSHLHFEHLLGANTGFKLHCAKLQGDNYTIK